MNENIFKKVYENFENTYITKYELMSNVYFLSSINDCIKLLEELKLRYVPSTTLGVHVLIPERSGMNKIIEFINLNQIEFQKMAHYLLTELIILYRDYRCELIYPVFVYAGMFLQINLDLVFYEFSEYDTYSNYIYNQFITVLHKYYIDLRFQFMFLLGVKHIISKFK